MALAPASANRVASGLGAVTGEERQNDGADFRDREKSDAISGTMA